MASPTDRVLLDWRETDTPARWTAWRIGFFPSIALLGVTLPIAFLSWTDRYLYYLQPAELIPTYGTAWLLLAVPALPLSLLCALALKRLEALAGLRWLHRALVVSLLGLAAASMVAALSYATLLWLNQVGLLLDFPIWGGLLTFSLAAIALLALTGRAGEALITANGFAKYGAALGALSLASVPFSGWSNGAQAPSTALSSGLASSRSKPNILLVTIDTLSASHMSLYGAARETTPRLEEFARAATTFDRAYANANFTTPGISSILTATRPWSHRALQLPSWPSAAARNNSIPALLSRDGYSMGYFSSNAFASPNKNGMGAYFTSGTGDRVPYFSFCSDRLSAALPYDCPAAELPPFIFGRRVWNKIRSVLDTNPNRHFDPRSTIRPALEWLAGADRRKPVFLWVHFFPPHAPYATPSPWLGEFDSSNAARDAAHSEPKVAYLFGSTPQQEVLTFEARYDESIKYMDHYVGELLEQATKLLGNNTVVVVTADHGESFEHGYGEHAGPALYESLVHIPLIIRLPFQTQGARTSVAAEQVDIGPTLAELAGLEPPSSWEGRSLLGSLRPGQGDSPTTDKPVFTMDFEENHRNAALTTGSVAVVDGHWKLVHYTGALHYPKMPVLHDELYDLASDPGELNNRFSEQPEQAALLRKLIDSQLALHGAAPP